MNRQNRLFRKMRAGDEWISAVISSLWNRWQFWKARRLADLYCEERRERVYVLPIQGHYVVTPRSDVRAANKQVNKHQRKNIFDLLTESVYTVTYDALQNRVKREKYTERPWIERITDTIKN